MYSRPEWRSIPRTLSLSPTIEVSTSNDVWGGKVQACVDPFASGPRTTASPPRSAPAATAALARGRFFFFFSLQSLGRFHDDTSPYPSPISGGTLDLRLSMLRPRRRKAEQNVATAVRLLRVRRIIVICKVVSVSCI